MTASAAISILSAILQIAKWWTEWVTQRGYIDQGRQQVINENLKAATDAIAKANAAREAVERDAARDPSTIVRPDEFERRE